MSSSNEKFRAIALSLLMVLSISAGVVSLSGSAVAAPPGNVATDSTSDDIVVPGERTIVADFTTTSSGNISNVTVNLAGGTDSANVTADDVTSITVELYNGSTVVASSQVNYDVQPKPVSLASGNVTDVDGVRVLAEVSGAAENNDIIDAEVNATDAAGTPAGFNYDTAGNQTVQTETDARLRGEAEYQNGTPATNVTLDIIDLDTGTVVIDNVTTRGFDTAAPGSWGPRVASPGNYTAVLDPQSPLQGRFSDFSTQVSLESGETETIFTTLDENLFADSANVEDVQGFVGDTETFTVEVLDQNGDPLEGATVTVTKVSGSSAVNIVGSTTNTTNANGEAQFDVTGTQVASAEFEFVATASGESASDTATATFIQSGEGNVAGTVSNLETTNPVEDASVWAVQASQYDINTRHFNTTLNLDGDATNDDDNTVWVRIVDNETGEIVDNDLYDVRTAEHANSSGTGVRMIEALNTSDSAEGEGFAVVDTDNDSRVMFNVTRLQDREYYVQVSEDAWNASDDRLAESLADGADPSEVETFLNVTNWNASTGNNINTGGVNPVVFSPSSNLTIDRTMERATLSGSNLVDSPGFINDAGVDTDGTDATGFFQLSKLYSDYQAGVVYVLIATKPGFSTDFADVIVTEDGELEFEEGQGSNEMFIEPEPVDADLNLTNIALVTNASTAPEATQDPTAYENTFSNQTDEFIQRVPRDGDTLDVVLVETTIEGTDEAISREVTLHVPDLDELGGADASNFDGSWVVPDDVEVVSSDPANDTVTIRTDSNGTAIVWLQSDFSTSDLDMTEDPHADVVCGDEETGTFSGITGVVTSDVGATDATCKEFAGVTQFQKASLSGILSDQQDTRVSPTVVYTRNIRWDGGDHLVTIRPVDDQNPLTTTWNVTHYEEDFASTSATDTPGAADPIPGELVSQETGVTFSELGAYEFGTSFPNIDSEGPFKLAENSQVGDSEFTLKDVPAVPPSTGPSTTSYDVRGIALQKVIAGQLAIGNASAATKPGFTDDANIAFPFIAAENVEVTTTIPGSSTRATVNENVSVHVQLLSGGQSIDVTANVTLTTDLGQFSNGMQTIEVVAENGTATVTLTSATGGTATIEAVSAGGATGQTTVEILTPDDTRAAVSQYEDVSAAKADGYHVEPIFFNSTEGAQGFAAVRVDLWNDSEIDPLQPDTLLYTVDESDGTFDLIGVMWMGNDVELFGAHPHEVPGHAGFNVTPHEHLVMWGDGDSGLAENPNGTFAAWNPAVETPDLVDFEDQTSDGDSVTVEEVDLPDAGYVVIHEVNETTGAPGPVIGVSEKLSVGKHTDVTVQLDQPISEDQELIAMAHVDRNDNDVFEFPGPDIPYLNLVGPPHSFNPVPFMESAQITVSTDDQTIVEQYDTDDSGTISITELGQAASDYANGDITIAELGQVAAAYASS